jgi:hypothetical protein
MNKNIVIFSLLSIVILGLVAAFEVPHHSAEKLIVTGNVYNDVTGEWMSGVRVTIDCLWYEKNVSTDSDGMFVVVFSNYECSTGGIVPSIKVMGRTYDGDSSQRVPLTENTYVSTALIGTHAGSSIGN